MSTVAEIGEIRKRFEDENLRQRFNELVAIGEKPGPEAAQKRGRDFEALFLDLLDVHRLLLRRSYHTADDRSEQIDGALEISGRVTLVEAKWVESGIAASELFAFLGKVEGKFVGTIGIFVSYVELSQNFISALRAGRRQSVLVVHGSDVGQLFDVEFPLQRYLEECVRHVSIDNDPHLSAAAFTDARKREVRAAAVNTKGELKALLEQLASVGASAAAIAAAEDIPSRLAANVRNLVDVFPEFRVHETLRAQIPKYIASAVVRMPDEELEDDRDFFRNLFPATILDPGYVPIHRAMSHRLAHASTAIRNVAERVLVEAWNEHLGSYENENILAEVTEILWPELTAESKRKLLGWFVHFVNSHRRRHFPQVQLAQRMLRDERNAVLRDEVLLELVREEFSALLKTENDPPWARRWLERSFENTARLLPDDVMKVTFDRVERELAKRASPGG